MTTLHEAAWGAYVASQQDETAAARQLLATVLDPYDPSDLPVVHVDVTPTRTMMVFDADTFHLATVIRTTSEDDPEQVWVAQSKPNGTWQTTHRVTSLAKLGELVGPPPEGPDDPQYPVWYARWSPDGWPKDSIVWFPEEGDQLYRSTVPDNAWRPDGGYGWEPVTG